MLKYTINSENSSDHWKPFNPIDGTLLDIGCGRWYTEELNELSPLYFKQMKAKRIIGIDSNNNDIEFYNKITSNNSDFTFIHTTIDSTEKVRELLLQYNITGLKVDIEGDEVHLLELTTDDLRSIEEIAIEFHSDELKGRFLEKIPEWGFKIHTLAYFINTPPSLGVIFASRVQIRG